MARPVNQEELDFLKAIEDYKKKGDKLFLSWTEVLSIVKDLGYSRTLRTKNNKKTETVKASQSAKSQSAKTQSAKSKSAKSKGKTPAKAKKSALKSA
jgi:UDP-N-acetylmuramyl tripeptide synthase